MLQVERAGTVQVGGTPQISKQKANIDELRKRDSVLVRGRFNNLENPGGTFRFVVKLYKNDPVMKYELRDGHVYELPRGVARHLNNDVGRTEHQFLLDERGNPSTMIGRRIRRVMFEHLEFVDIDDIGPQNNIVTVEKIPKLKKG